MLFGIERREFGSSVGIGGFGSSSVIGVEKFGGFCGGRGISVLLREWVGGGGGNSMLLLWYR
jgi:hypothetical protein